jgi:hypothetical protein
MCDRRHGATMMPMTTTDYLIDSLLVLLVLLQIKERTLTTRTLVRPLVIVGVAVAEYMHGFPTAGNDVLLIVAVGVVGATIGVASGLAAIMRVREDGAVTARAGWASASLWVAGMGSRFAFVYWITHSGAATIGRFSAAHSISSGEAWTVALLAMAVAEVLGRTLVMATRRRHLAHTATAATGHRPVAQIA